MANQHFVETEALFHWRERCCAVRSGPSWLRKCVSNRYIITQHLLGLVGWSVTISCSFAGVWLCPFTPCTVVQARKQEGLNYGSSFLTCLLNCHLTSPLASTWSRVVLHLQTSPQVKTACRASLVAQWLRICLPMQGTWVRALVWEDPTCHGATKPVSHNCWACASGACAPQQERLR